MQKGRGKCTQKGAPHADTPEKIIIFFYFYGGILRALAPAFADSPYVSQSEWARTLGELLDLKSA